MTNSVGTYVLIIELPTETPLEVGALGTHSFEAGWYAYVGSALGSGGFKRIDRHRRVAAGEHPVRHWHIDYLLGHPASSLAAVRTVPGVDGECRIASTLRASSVPAFGCSDCSCHSHLFFEDERETLLEDVSQAISRVSDGERGGRTQTG